MTDAPVSQQVVEVKPAKPSRRPPMDKYREFRNFMVNELGITRDDIEAWTKEAVAVQVGKLVGQMNLDAIAKREIEIRVREALGIQPYSKDSLTVSRALTEAFKNRITISIKETPDAQ